MTPAPAWESTWLPRFHFEQPVSSTAQPFLIKLDYQLRGGDLNLQPLVYLGLTLGMAVGFTILGAILVIILQDLARHNLPLIGDMLAQIVSVVQKQLE